jgi:hypothetical protein
VLKHLPHNTPDSSWRSDLTGFTFITPTVDGGVNDNYAIGIIDSATVYRNRGSPLYSAVWLRRTLRPCSPLQSTQRGSRFV